MSAEEIRKKKIAAELARQRLTGTVTQLQHRLKPATLAGNAWDGVKERSADIADDAIEAVKARPVAASAAVGAVTLFLARQPIRSAFSWLFAKKPDETVVTADLARTDRHYDLTAPVGAGSPQEGAIA
ncbi:MAG: DUF3618 domain-containing protein [Allosphingosinicella sp.]